MVKDDKHRTRGLIAPEGELGLLATPALFAFIGQMQEEVHRFAITYHRQVRGKSVYGSTLDKIPGVGERRRKALLRRFGSVAGVRAADLEALCQVVPREVAESIQAALRRGSEAEGPAAQD